MEINRNHIVQNIEIIISMLEDFSNFRCNPPVLQTKISLIQLFERISDRFIIIYKGIDNIRESYSSLLKAPGEWDTFDKFFEFHLKEWNNYGLNYQNSSLFLKSLISERLYPTVENVYIEGNTLYLNHYIISNFPVLENFWNYLKIQFKYHI